MTAHFGIDLLKMRDKFWAEASESSCVENISNLIGYQSYTQNFLKMYSRKLLQIVQRGEYLFFFQKMFEFKIKSPVGKFSKKHLERYQVRDPSQRVIVMVPLMLVTEFIFW